MRPDVGKTALVEGWPGRSPVGKCRAVLQDTRLLVLDMGLLQAGASIKGEFERAQGRYRRSECLTGAGDPVY